MKINCDIAMWSTRHPILVSALSAIAVGGWTNVLAIQRWMGAVVALGVFLLSLILWMRGGPLRRFVERRCSDHA